MRKLTEKLKSQIFILSQNESFVHHKWFFKYHLELVEKIALELCKRYQEANLNLVEDLIWIHDYGKISGIKDENEVLQKSEQFLLEIGFEQKEATQIIVAFKIFESKMTMDLSEAPIEVRIVSTADAVSHMFGPFYQMYCYENPEISVEELMESNKRKLEKDWSRKIVLPEVKKVLQRQYDFLKQSFGDIPEEIFG